jgi:hypothetical protein
MGLRFLVDLAVGWLIEPGGWLWLPAGGWLWLPAGGWLWF